jgi:hypothetical protein
MQPSQFSNIDGRSDSCVSLALRHLEIQTDIIEAVQKVAPIHTLPYPFWLRVLELCANGHLEPYEWQGGTLAEFIQEHPTGKYFVIVFVTNDADITQRSTHAVAVTDGVAFNASNLQRPVFRTWKVQN